MTEKMTPGRLVAMNAMYETGSWFGDMPSPTSPHVFAARKRIVADLPFRWKRRFNRKTILSADGLRALANARPDLPDIASAIELAEKREAAALDEATALREAQDAACAARDAANRARITDAAMNVLRPHVPTISDQLAFDIAHQMRQIVENW